jgi:hypothetical protein
VVGGRATGVRYGPLAQGAKQYTNMLFEVTAVRTRTDRPGKDSVKKLADTPRALVKGPSISGVGTERPPAGIRAVSITRPRPSNRDPDLVHVCGC